MRPRKYPLDPLARLRAKQVDDATSLLANAIRVRQEAERAEGAAVTKRDVAAEEARVVGDGEQRALERGELRAEDLAWAASWRTRVEVERAELESRLAKAMTQARAAEGSEGTAQDGLARARADAEVVTRDRAKWEEAGRRKEEAVEEESVADAFRGKPA
jgi:hypothetical protein